MIGMVLIIEKMKESRLRWFDYIKRKVINVLVRNNELIQVEGTKKGRVRQKTTLIEVVKNDLSIKKITENMILDRTE